MSARIVLSSLERGQPLWGNASDGEWTCPDPDGLAADANGDRWGNVYMAARDKDNRNAIVKYNNNGTLITYWPSPLVPVQKWGVKNALVDHDGTIYVGVESQEVVGIEVYAEQ